MLPEPRALSGSVAPLLPGLGLCAIVTLLAMGVNRVFPTASPLLIAILVGAVLANIAPIPAQILPGLTFSSKKLLRVGIALLGLQLVFSDILGLGWGVMALVVAVVGLGIAGTMFVGRLLGLSWTQRVLIACGFSICGASAIAAVDGVVDAKEEEVLTGIALVVVFGTAMIFAVPMLAGMIGLDAAEAGIWAGGSIHEVAQVIAAGGAIGGSALAVAAVVKLARVLMLAPVMAVLSVRARRMSADSADAKHPPLVPLFVLAFVGCAALRSTGVLPEALLGYAKLVQTGLLTAAMFALGTAVQVSTLRKVGGRPLVLAAISTVWVATIALVGVLLVG